MALDDLYFKAVPILRAAGIKAPVSYQRYIQSKTWKDKAKKARKRAGYRCKRCGRYLKHAQNLLNLHHKTYRNLGAEKRGETILLCNACHRAEHGL